MRKTLVICVALAAMLTSGVAHADNMAKAREAYRKGREAYKAGDYREALIYLKKAYKLKPMPALLRYTGETYYKLNQAQEAIKYFRLYLKAAPMAADRAKVESKVRQLELIVGPADEEEDEFAPPPPPPPPPMPDDATGPDTAAPPPPDDPVPAPAPAPRPAPKPRRSAVDQPLGADDEDPLLAADRRRKAAQRAGGGSTRRGGERGGTKDSGSGGLFIAGVTTAALGAVGIIVGGVMAGLANGKASELQDIVKEGNPDMNKPTVSYSKKHHDLVVSYDSFNKGAIGGFVAGGVLLGTGVVLIVVNVVSGPKKKADASESRVVFAPVIGQGTMGMTGQVRF